MLFLHFVESISLKALRWKTFCWKAFLWKRILLKALEITLILNYPTTSLTGGASLIRLRPPICINFRDFLGRSYAHFMFTYRLSATYLSQKSNFSPKAVILRNLPFWSFRFVSNNSIAIIVSIVLIDGIFVILIVWNPPIRMQNKHVDMSEQGVLYEQCQHCRSYDVITNSVSGGSH